MLALDVVPVVVMVEIIERVDAVVPRRQRLEILRRAVGCLQQRSPMSCNPSIPKTEDTT